MADKFDPYREALVMETVTVLPDEYSGIDPIQRSQIEESLHASPEEASTIEYIRTHTGFCRRIIASPEDVDRVTSA